MRICVKCGEPARGPRSLYCASCKKEEQRRLSREGQRKRRRDPRVRAAERKRNKEYRRKHPEVSKEYNQLRWQAIKANPEWHAEILAVNRMDRRLRRERAGLPIKPLTQKQYNALYGNGFGKGARLPAAPLREVVMKELERLSMGELSRLSGVPERRFYGLKIRESERVSYSVADRICCAIGVPLEVLYPETANA